MSTFNDKNILITGGACGIGRLMAEYSIKKGANVVIWDINSPAIEDTVKHLSCMGNIKGYTVDISDYQQVKEVANITKQDMGNIDILINNAGIVVGKYFHEHSQNDIIKTMEINSTAPMLITACFLKEMMDKNEGHICNIASSAGIVSNPKMSVYAASKWSVIGWSDSLRIEMIKLNKNIKITTILPYYISTGMFAGVESSVIPIQKPEIAARKIISAIEKDKILITIPGFIYRITRLTQGMFPIKIFDWIAGKIFGIYKTMDNFTGRKQ